MAEAKGPVGLSGVRSPDLVGEWPLLLTDGIHTVEFEHGKTTGKRVLRIDGKEVMRKDWMLKLVGDVRFRIGQTKCRIVIRASGVLFGSFSYELIVNGFSWNTFAEHQKKNLMIWMWGAADKLFRIVFEKDTLDVWVNGHRVTTTGEFTDGGSETYFPIGDKTSAVISTRSSGHHKHGLVHRLFFEGAEITPVVTW